MNIKELIKKKRDGQTLHKEELEFVVRAVADRKLEREQIGAMLMAIWMRGMEVNELSHFTNAMRYSGMTFDWPDEWKASVVDKHSTGGVGDKVSLVLTPALAACGLKVPMISGRALGHTGGTLDKLESIPGFCVALSPHKIKELLNVVGCCIVGQTDDVVPADRVLYSSREITSTIDSLPLIVSSIISKKAAENPASLVLDVKYGRGAFMKDEIEAKKLARLLVDVSNGIGIRTTALLTSMDHPLGFNIGNALEVLEALNCLHGDGPSDLEDLVVTEGSLLLKCQGKVVHLESGCRLIREVIHNGKALEKFRQMAAGQGCSAEDAERLCRGGEEFTVLPAAKHKTTIQAKTSGFVHGIEPLCMSRVTAVLGGARNGHDDRINHAVGVVLHCKTGQRIDQGSVLATVHHDTSPLDTSIIEDITKAIAIESEIPKQFIRIGEIVE